ncbi:hypothetical protein JST99_04015 [Candidatus Dependentiae bacterium]|nr:hypothetical protein [Candidatus Dependentiae bacterium]
MKIFTLSRVLLRSVAGIALCMAHTAYDVTIKRSTVTRSRGIERSDMKPDSAEEQAYKKLRATESKRRGREIHISTDLAQAMVNPTKWARTFITVYELPDWNRNLSGDQVNALIKQISDYIVSLDDAKDAVPFIKAANKIPKSLPALLQKELRTIRKIWVDATKEELLSEHPINFVATTANILGSFDDPFEFEGDYGTASNTTREKVFGVIVSKEAIGKNLPAAIWDNLLKENPGKTKEQLLATAIQKDKENGPTLQQVATKELLEQITEKLQTLRVPQADIDALAAFVGKYGNEKIFYFMRNNPPDLLKLEKALKDHYADQGKSFDLPVLGSKTKLTGTTSNELKKNLVDAVFIADVLKQANPTFVDKKDGNKVKPIIVNIDKYTPALDKFFANGTNKELHAFATPAGLTFFYWLYQALIFDLVAKEATDITAINEVKAEFAKALGDAQRRAAVFRKKLITAKTKLLFTQESDKFTRDELTKDGLFLPIGAQNSKDGTVILLASDLWEPNFEVIPFDEYGKFKAGKLTAILATQKETQQKFLLASGHGNSDDAADGREQMKRVAQKLQQLMEERAEEILLIIGVDANTKKTADVKAFQKLLTELGLVSTQVGPTTIKRRMGTVQHNKAGLYAVDEEDYIIVSKNQLMLRDVTVGFGTPDVKPDLTISLPNLNNQSDHYAVSARIQAEDTEAAKKSDDASDL